MTNTGTRKILLIGKPRSGKSSAAFLFPNAVFIDCDGTSLERTTNATRYLRSDDEETIRQQIGTISALQTLVLDSVDSIILSETAASESQAAERLASHLANAECSVICTANTYPDGSPPSARARAIARRFPRIANIQINREKGLIVFRDAKPASPDATRENIVFEIAKFGYDTITPATDILPPGVERNTYTELRFLIERMNAQKDSVAPYRTAREFMVGERIWDSEQARGTKNPPTSPEEMTRACETARVLSEELAIASTSDL